LRAVNQPVSSTQKKNLVSSYLKGIDNQINKRGSTNMGTSVNAPISSSSGAGHKLIGTSRNNQLIAPAGTKNKVGGSGAHIHTALVNLGNTSIGASLDDITGV